MTRPNKTSLAWLWWTSLLLCFVPHSPRSFLVASLVCVFFAPSQSLSILVRSFWRVTREVTEIFRNPYRNFGEYQVSLHLCTEPGYYLCRKTRSTSFRATQMGVVIPASDVKWVIYWVEIKRFWSNDIAVCFLYGINHAPSSGRNIAQILHAVWVLSQAPSSVSSAACYFTVTSNRYIPN